jgi:glycogen debranching enzyme
VEPATSTDAITVIEHANFAVSDRGGDIHPGTYHGFFAADTRFLSRLTLRIGGKRPEPLSSVTEDHGAATFYLSNPAFGGLPPSTIAIMRDRSVADGLDERIRLIHYGMSDVRVRLTVEVAADFADIFEVRGWRRLARTIHLERDGRHLLFRYERRPRRRTTRIELDRDPEGEGGTLAFDAVLERGVPWDLNLRITTGQEHEGGVDLPPWTSSIDPGRVRHWAHQAPILQTADRRLDLAWRQAILDIGSLLLSVDDIGFIPAAGLPWYMAVFGRDSAITSMQTMLLGRDLSAGTLEQLAAYQGTTTDPFREEQPGKIPHEVRSGELAALDHVPHGRYYGSTDATPLFVLLFLEACRWAGWLQTDGHGPVLESSARARGPLPAQLATALPAVEAAMSWIDAQADADGLVWYRRAHRAGIRNQVWKDSGDSYRFADGQIANPPIAAVEVQGYVVAARHGMAGVYEALGRWDDAARQHRLAAQLAATIDAAFWMPEAGTYAMGIDRRRRQIDSVTSNPGHLLWAGAIGDERADAVVDRLLARDSFSGWGVRTMSSEMAAYNPISYHNGTVWPHDNSLIAAGMARYGHDVGAWRVIDAQLDAVATDPFHRLPELFAGFDRRSTSDLVRYAVACAPQAWASGAVVLFVQTLLGVSPRAGAPDVRPLKTGPSLELQRAVVGAWAGTLRKRRGKPGEPNDPSRPTLGI